MLQKNEPLSPADAVLRSFAIHNRIHLYLLDALAPEAWTAEPPDPPHPATALIPLAGDDLDLAHARLPPGFHVAAWQR